MVLAAPREKRRYEPPICPHWKKHNRTQHGSRRLGSREAGLLEQLSQRALDSRFPFTGGELARLGTSDNDEVVPVRQLAGYRPERLTQQSLYAISLDCAANFASHRHAQARTSLDP